MTVLTPTPDTETPEIPRPPRLLSLDAFRGLAVASMILVNNPGSWAHVYPPLLHAEWHGVTPTDLIFPFFLFAVGSSLSFSFAARRASGQSLQSLQLHVLRRATILYLLGLLLALFPTFSFEGVRLVGVLQRIGLVYLVAGTLVIYLSRPALIVISGLLLASYWAIMSWVPVPGFGAGDLSVGGNLAAHIDRLLLGDHMWRGGGGVYDPEGLLSTAPAVVTTLAGFFTGDFLRSRRDADLFSHRTTSTLLLVATALLTFGWFWGLWFPLNKALWTSSYVVYTAGWALLVLALLFWLVDVLKWRAWAKPLVIYGKNSVTIFVASGLLATVLIRWQVAATRTPDANDTTSVHAYLYDAVFAPHFGPTNGSLAFASVTVLFWLLVAWAMHRRGLYLKV